MVMKQVFTLMKCQVEQGNVQARIQAPDISQKTESGETSVGGEPSPQNFREKV